MLSLGKVSTSIRKDDTVCGSLMLVTYFLCPVSAFKFF